LRKTKPSESICILPSHPWWYKLVRPCRRPDLNLIKGEHKVALDAVVYVIVRAFFFCCLNPWTKNKSHWTLLNFRWENVIRFLCKSLKPQRNKTSF
jgi:hypothetical protein